MRIYLRDQRNAEAAAILKKAGVQCFTRQEDFGTPENPRSLTFFDQFDALMVESTSPTQESMYLFAQAMLQRKPALCYYQKNREPRELLGYLARPEAKTIIAHCYHRKNLEYVLLRFLDQLNLKEESREKATIKFTLRITPSLERYLTWLVHGKGLTKADFLRNLLEKYSVNDRNYHFYKKSKNMK